MLVATSASDSFFLNDLAPGVARHKFVPSSRGLTAEEVDEERCVERITVR